MPGQGVPPVGRQAEPVSLGGRLVDAASLQIPSARLSGWLFLQHPTVKDRRQVVDPVQGFPLVQPPFFLRGRGPFLYSHSNPLGQELDRVGKGEPFHFHDKGDGIAADAAAEAVEDPPRRIDVEGGGFLPVEGAEPLVIGARLPEAYIIGNYLNYRCPLANLIDLFVRYYRHRGPMATCRVREEKKNTRKPFPL